MGAVFVFMSMSDVFLLHVEHLSPADQAGGVYNVTIGYCAHLHDCCESCSYLSQIINVNS